MVDMAKEANGNTVWKTCDTIEEAVVFQSTDHDAEAHQEVQLALQDAQSAAAEESEDHWMNKRRSHVQAVEQYYKQFVSEEI